MNFLISKNIYWFFLPTTQGSKVNTFTILCYFCYFTVKLCIFVGEKRIISASLMLVTILKVVV